MKNVRFTIEYEGTNYCGWQRQRGHPSIQEVIEKTLAEVTGEEMTLYGSGRTDAGVHALGQVANFRTRSRLTPRELMKAANAKLPKDIVIKDARRVSKDFNSRTAAKRKTYLYRIFNAGMRPALLRDFVTFVPDTLSLRRMKTAAALLEGRHDFRAFCSSSSPGQNCVRHISRIEVTRCDREIHIRVTADGFLYNMVRTIAGTLMLAGRGKLTPRDVRSILASKDRTLAGPTAPAKGLYLVEVKY
jgi:tRNA pseudouridine38-40 synthase